MHWFDWLILSLSLIGISALGVWKTRGHRSTEAYLASSRSTPWWAIGLSIMATQASAITFISTPGLGYTSGLSFVQFYFGLPIAMIIIARFFVPVFFRLKVYTAYEYLEKRFDRKTRSLAAGLFLLQRGLAAGITIYAPSIILAKILGWSLYANILVIGMLVIVYTVSGGTTAVTQTHKQQMAVIFTGIFIAFGFLLYYIQLDVPFGRALDVAAIHGRLKTLDWDLDLSTRYSVWSGIIGGTFLMLSYFGTDQSQVQRYLSGRSVKEINTGLYFNALLKIPMQFFILFIGVLVFLFYQLNEPPLHFDQLALEHVAEQGYEKELTQLRNEHHNLSLASREAMIDDHNGPERLKQIESEKAALKSRVNDLISLSGYAGKVKKESDFVFITFVLNYLPIGLIGLIMAVLFSAAMSSTSAELNALGSTSLVDFYRANYPNSSDLVQLRMGKLLTAGWGVLAILFAIGVNFMENLVEAVNILGSLFYGTILGVFVVAFFFKRIKGDAVFGAALFAELCVVSLFVFDDEVQKLFGTKVEYLWFNLIGCALVVGIAHLWQFLKPEPPGSLKV